MATTDFNISKEDVRNYINEIDLTNRNNIKVLSYIQLLDRRIFYELIYNMITGYISIESLYNITINNSNIQSLLTSLDTLSSNFVNRYDTYKRKLEGKSNYKTFMVNLISNNKLLLNKINISSTEYATRFKVEKIAISTNPTFKTLSSVKYLYNTLTDKMLDSYMDSLYNTTLEALPEVVLNNETLFREAIALHPNVEGVFNDYVLPERNIIRSSILIYVNGKLEYRGNYNIVGRYVIFKYGVTSGFNISASYYYVDTSDTTPVSYLSVIYDEVLSPISENRRNYKPLHYNDMVQDSISLYVNGVRQISNIESSSSIIYDYVVMPDGEIIFIYTKNILASDRVSISYSYRNVNIDNSVLNSTLNFIPVTRQLSSNDKKTFYLEDSSIYPITSISNIEVYSMGELVNNYTIDGDYLIFDEELEEPIRVIANYLLETDIISSSYYGLKYIIERIDSKIANYGLIYDNDKIKLELDYNTSIIGFILREMYNFIPYVNFSVNRKFLLTEMTNDYESDYYDKSGIYTIRRLQNEYKWIDLDDSLDDKEFLDRLILTYFIRITITKLYLGVHFNQSQLDKELYIFETIKEIMIRQRVYILYLVGKLKNDLEPESEFLIGYMSDFYGIK
jgi:hypothetical protein